MWKDSQRAAARARFPGADSKAREVPVVETRAAEQGGAGVNGKPTGKRREPGLSPPADGPMGGKWERRPAGPGGACPLRPHRPLRRGADQPLRGSRRGTDTSSADTSTERE